MRVSQFMTAPVVTIRPDEHVNAAARLLVCHGFAALPVVTDGDVLVGIVSEADVLRRRVVADPRLHLRNVPSDHVVVPTLVRDVMTKDVMCVPPTVDQATCAELLVGKGVRSLPVVEGDRLVGIVGRRDILRLVARGDADIAADVYRLLDEFAPAAGRWDVAAADGCVLLTGDAGGEAHRLADRLARTVAGVADVRFASSARSSR